MKTPIQITNALIEALNSQDLEGAVNLYAETYVGSDVSEEQPRIGKAGIKKSITKYFTAIPDIVISAEETVSEENSIVMFWKATGHFSGSLLNIPGRGQAVTLNGLWFFEIENNQIVKCRTVWDVAALLREIGLLPELI